MITLMERKKRHMQSFVKQTLFLALIVLGATGAWAQTTIDLSGVTTDTTVTDGKTLTGTLAHEVKISIASNATVTLQNVSINADGGWNSGDYAGITCEGNATIILKGTNTVKGFDAYYPGIYVPTGYTLTIQGSGSLNASSNDYGAGIGGGSQLNCGNIVIAGGTITATGGKYTSGIGAGYEASCGTISITGGTVNATGGLFGSGIGTGSKGDCGAITISGGFVTATGGGNAAGIGAGYVQASCVSIDITGGTVTATGGTNAAGIGTGLASSCGPITITDGVTQVTATKGEDAPNSIGAGLEGECSVVTIGGTIYWDGSNYHYQNNGNDPKTGIVKSPYYYPIPNYTLGEIPSGWTVTANGTEVQVTPYESPNQDKGYASIPVDAEVVLTPPDPPRVKSVTLIDPLTIPLTFEAKEAGAKVAFTEATSLNLSIEYSMNGGEWTTYTDSIPLTNIGDKVSFRGNNTKYAVSPEGDASYFSCTADCYVYGNVMSLIDKNNFATTTALTSDNTFCSLFNNNSHIYNHATKSLELPAMILKEYCYASMFKGCTNLTSAPALPAISMAEKCYLNMFQGCTSLTAAPALPATSLAEQCYEGMFSGCTSLETAPALPATNLAGYCYSDMFDGCTSLATAPALPATTLKSGCYFSMFFNCTNLTSAPTLPAETLASGCYSAMFKGCTSLQTAPALPATTLDYQCYWSMFENCTNLTTAPELPAETLAEECYYNMFSGCTSLTTAPILPAETLTYACYSYMFDGCSNLNRVICLATDISADYCTAHWLLGVAQTGTFIKPATMNDWELNSPNGIPVGWTTTIYEPQPLTFEAKEANATVTFTQ